MYCNPDVCPCCQYIGEGDSLCEETGEIVLEDWEPTEHFMGPGCPYQKMEWVGQHLKSLPSIDPVHAVGGCYCRECIFSREDGEKALECHLVAAGWTIVQATDFCSRGRRREHEKEE